MTSAWIPACADNKNLLDFGSWIDVHEIPRKLGRHEQNQDFSHTVMSQQITNCQGIIIYPEADICQIILNWMEASRIMYNYTIQILDAVIFDNNNQIVKDYDQYLKANYLRPKINNMKCKILDFCGDKQLPAHSLDQIALWCASMFDSSIKNWERRQGIAKFIAEKKEEAKRAKNEKRALKLQEKCRSEIKNKKSNASAKSKKACSKTKTSNSKNNKINNVKENQQKIPDKPFVMKPISSSERNKWMIIESTAINVNRNSFCVSQLGNLKTSTKITRARTSKLIYDSYTKRFTLWLPRDLKPKQHTTRRLTCGIDPGIKTFLTVYSENECYEIGHEIDFEKHFNKASVYHSLRKMRHYTKAQYKKKLAKHNDKLKRKVKDMQFKIAKMLCEKYSVIKIGVLKVQSIMKRKDLSPADKRKLSALSHYKFRQILKYQGEKYGCDVQEVNEYMTTKTCSACGHTYNVGKSRVYECKNRKCKLIADRDINAAKNIRYKDPNPKKKKRKKRSRYPKRKPKPTDVQK